MLETLGVAQAVNSAITSKKLNENRLEYLIRRTFVPGYIFGFYIYRTTRAPDARRTRVPDARAGRACRTRTRDAGRPGWSHISRYWNSD